MVWGALVTLWVCRVGDFVGGLALSLRMASPVGRQTQEEAQEGAAGRTGRCCQPSRLPAATQPHAPPPPQVTLMSFETEALELAFGNDMLLRFARLVQAKHNWCLEQLKSVLAARKVRASRPEVSALAWEQGTARPPAVWPMGNIYGSAWSPKGSAMGGNQKY